MYQELKASSHDLLALQVRVHGLAGDGCIHEGISHDSYAFANHLGLGNLIAFYNDTSIHH